MTQISWKEAISQISAVLRETFEGPAESWSYYTDHGPEAGLFGTLRKLSAADASRSEEGTSIAAHVHHIVFALNEATSWIGGDYTQRNWKESWDVQSVSDTEWTALIDRLQNEYANVQSIIPSCATDSAEAMGGAIGIVAHTAFHFGSIRQKVLKPRARSTNGA